MKQNIETKNNPANEQEHLYRFPYHWFPEDRLKGFERNEKKRIVFDLLTKYIQNPINHYLDVGCGDGRWTTDIHDHLFENLSPSINSLGIDFSDRAIGFAKLISPYINFEVHKGENIPYSSSYFDLVTAIEVIEHVEDNQEKIFISELRRLLKPNGLLLLTTPSWNLPLTNHHFRHYSIQRITELLANGGLEILSIRGQSIQCGGMLKKIRRIMAQSPKIWTLWKFTYRETLPEKALNLIITACPK